MKRLEHLEWLAGRIVESLGCTLDCDGNEPSTSDETFNHHAHDQENADGTVGCLRCLAVEALETRP
ncbi:MAG: hypothetical protein LC640_09010 [Frankia sp.]|nr:hypothetical protein [Frankia sp.]